MKIVNNVPVWGNMIDVKALNQIETCLKTAYMAAMMADHHSGYSVPIGGVVAYRNQVSPSGVGFDIACGNMAVLTDLHFDEIKNRISLIADDIFNNISFGVGRKNNERVDHPLSENMSI